MSLSDKLAEVQGEMGKLADEIEAIGTVAKAENRDLTEDELKLLGEASDRFDKLEAQATTLKKLHDQSARITARRQVPDTPTVREQIDGPANAGVIVANGARRRSKIYNSDFDALAVGKWIQATLANNSDAQDWLNQNAAHYRADMSGGVPAAGGYTVPKPLAETIIRLVEQFGVYRRNARTAVMTSNTLDVPSREDGLTVYYPGEAGSITPSDITFGQVNLVAKKYAAMSVWSTELDEDSVISLTDLVTTEMAYAFAYAEDVNSFRGDGTGAFGGITGIENALQAGSKVTAATADPSSVTMDDFNMMVGKLPQYAGIQPKWYMHSYHYFVTVQALLQALGGTNMVQVEAGGGFRLLGYPVEFTQALPGATTASGELIAVFGDLNLGAFSGQRRNITMRLLTELFAQTDQLAMTATMRADSVIHSVGDATEPGAIIGLYLGV